MKFFENRFVARCLLFVTVLGITPFVAQGQLEDKVEDVQSVFYEYKGIGDRLESRSDAAENLVSIAVNYPDLATETEALRFAQAELYDCLWSDDLAELYAANEALEPAFQALYRALSAKTLSDTDQRAVESYVTTFNGAQRMIDSSDYNERVRKFRAETYYPFPAQQIAKWFDIDPPEFFGEPGVDRGVNAPKTDASALTVPEVPEAPNAPDAPDLDETINNFVDGITDYVNHTVHDALDDALDN